MIRMRVLAGSVLVHRTASHTFDQVLLHELTWMQKMGSCVVYPIATEICAYRCPFQRDILFGCSVGRDSGARVP